MPRDTQMAKGSADKAAVQYQKALEANPSFVPARLALARLALRDEDFTAAEKHLSKAVADGGGTAEVHLDLGVAYRGLGQPDKARDAFARAVEACPDGPIRDALNRLCDLYALYQIELDRGYLQEHGRLTGPRCKAVTRAVNELCNELRGDAEALVDAFGIPDRVLRAPIALR